MYKTWKREKEKLLNSKNVLKQSRNFKIFDFVINWKRNQPMKTALQQNLNLCLYWKPYINKIYF